MGNDGGSIPDRRDLVRTKPKAEQADKANQTRAKWLFCALSKRRLQEPIVSCELGKLYNKDSILEYLLDKSLYGDGEEICGHIRSLKDVKTLNLSPNTVPKGDDDTEDRPQFCCPYTIKEMNGSQPFVYISKCGCVSSLSGLKEMSTTPSPDEPSQLDICPQCSAKYDRNSDLVTINPSPEEERKMRLALTQKRASEPAKLKKEKKGTKRKHNEAMPDEDSTPSAKKKSVSSTAPVPSINATIATASKAVKRSLAAEEAKRKAAMTDAVKSLYQRDSTNGTKETFMTRGTFTRYA